MFKPIKHVVNGSHAKTVDAHINPAHVLFFEAAQKEQAGQSLVTLAGGGDNATSYIAVDHSPSELQELFGSGFIQLNRYDLSNRPAWSGPVYVSVESVRFIRPVRDFFELSFSDGSQLTVRDVSALTEVAR